MRPKTVYLHFNKHKAYEGFPWTVHLSSECIPASEIIVEVPMHTVWKPNKKDNPRAFLRCKGFVVKEENGIIRIVDKSPI